MINKIVFIDTIIVMLRIVTDNLSKVRSPNEPSLKLCDKSTHEVSTLISFYRRHHHDHLLHEVSTLVTTTISIITINTQTLFVTHHHHHHLCLGHFINHHYHQQNVYKLPSLFLFSKIQVFISLTALLMVHT